MEIGDQQLDININLLPGPLSPDLNSLNSDTLDLSDSSDCSSDQDVFSPSVKGNYLQYIRIILYIIIL